MASTAARSAVSTYWMASAGSPAFSDRLGQDLGDDGVGLERLAAAAQQHRIARLEAEPAASAVTLGRDS